MNRKNHEPDFSAGAPVYLSLSAALESDWLHIISLHEDADRDDGIPPYNTAIINVRNVSAIWPSSTYLSREHVDVLMFEIETDIKLCENADAEWVVLIHQEFGNER